MYRDVVPPPPPTTHAAYNCLPLPLLSFGKAPGLLRLFSGDPFPSLGLFTGVFVSTYPAPACLLLLVLLKLSKDRVCALALSQLGTSWAPGVTHEDLCPVDLPTPHPNQISQGCSRVSSKKLGPGSSRTLVDSGDAQFHHLKINTWNFSSICI